MKKIDFKIEDAGCYTCISHAPDKKGYPHTSKNGKRISVYRHIYEECFGEIPKEMLIRHTCDNRMCINLEHLIIGTYQDNMNDKMLRGRHRLNPAKGEKQGFAKLTDDKVKKILIDNRKHSEIAKEYGVTRQTIQCVKARKTWKHVEVNNE